MPCAINSYFVMVIRTKSNRYIKCYHAVLTFPSHILVEIWVKIRYSHNYKEMITQNRFVSFRYVSEFFFN